MKYCNVRMVNPKCPFPLSPPERRVATLLVVGSWLCSLPSQTNCASCAWRGGRRRGPHPSGRLEFSFHLPLISATRSPRKLLQELVNSPELQVSKAWDLISKMHPRDLGLNVEAWPCMQASILLRAGGTWAGARSCASHLPAVCERASERERCF